MIPRGKIDIFAEKGAKKVDNLWALNRNCAEICAAILKINIFCGGHVRFYRAMSIQPIEVFVHPCRVHHEQIFFLRDSIHDQVVDDAATLIE